MKVTVTAECIGCGLCVSTCPGVFEMGPEGKAQVMADPVTPDAEAEAEAAAVGCPVGAIKTG